MCSRKPKYNLGIVGAGRQGISILEALVPPRKEDESLRVLGVADLNPEAPGISYAERHNLLVTADFTELLKLPDLDIIVNATGRPEVSRRLQEEAPEGVIILNADRTCAGENFWDLISMERSQVESAIKLAGQRHDEIAMSPICPPERAKKKSIEVIKDVTPRRQLEEALQTSEEKTRQLFRQTSKSKAFLETIINGIEDQMMVIDLNYRIVEVNRALLEMVGLSRDEVVGKHCYEVSHHLEKPCSIPDHPCPLKDTLATGKAASATHVHFDRDSREHYIHVVCHPMFDEQGRIRQVIDLSRDITQEITTRNQRLHDDKMTSLGKLSASVVHEINNPLTGILNFIKLMQRLLGKPTRGEEELEQLSTYLDLVYKETSRVSKAVSNLLVFSRKTRPEFKPLNLNALLGESISLTEYQMRLQDIKVERRFAANLLLVMADQGQMKQAFLNLLLNAIDAMPDGGTLTLTTRNGRGQSVVAQIADTGVGISKESLSNIFEPFYTTKQTGSSVGLGLSVVYGIVRDHKGSIKVDSTVGRGTVFTVKLPGVKPEE